MTDLNDARRENRKVPFQGEPIPTRNTKRESCTTPESTESVKRTNPDKKSELISSVLSQLRDLPEAADIDDIGPILRKLEPLIGDLKQFDLVSVREKLIRAIGKRVSSPAKLVDTLFKNVSSKQRDSDGHGRTLELEIPEPWPEPVEGASVLDELSSILSKHLVLRDGASDAITLWIAHTFVFDLMEHSPRLTITSPLKRCGKSSLLRVLRALVPKPLTTANVSPSVLFRIVEKSHPTLLIDEADAFASRNEELRGLLNAGFEQGGAVHRCVGEDYEPRSFDVFAPVAIAAIGDLPDTIMDRSVVIKMERKLASQKVPSFRKKERNASSELRRKVARWIADNQGKFSDVEVSPPEGANDRAADCWEPLQIISSVAGGEWPSRCFKAFQAITGDEEDEPQRLSERLLVDIRTVFGNREKIPSKELLEKLIGLESSPWQECSRGRPLTSARMASLLRPFEVKSKTLRQGEQVYKGYARKDLEPVWSRYLPPLKGYTGYNVEITSDSSNLKGLQKPQCNLSKLAETTYDFNDVTDVTALNPIQRTEGRDIGEEEIGDTI